jgi:HSP20 family protein
MTHTVAHRFFDDTLDELFRGFFVRPTAYEDVSARPIRVDVSESETAYRVSAELPGVRKEDINITIQADTVSIAAEVRQEKEVKDGEWVLRSERRPGKVARTFAFEQEIDEARAEASYHDGVLELVLPKKAVAARKRVTVN